MDLFSGALSPSDLPPVSFLGFQHSQEILSGPPKLVLFWNGEP